MRFGIFGDLHDNEAAFEQVMDELDELGVDQLVFLGDAGRNQRLLDLLRDRNITCVFGNWEVSLLAKLDPARRTWVARWPALVRHGHALFTHATPAMPSTIRVTADVAALRTAGEQWLHLFPRLDRHEQAVWDALAAMEVANVRVVFHGHTHVQQVQGWITEDNGRRRLRTWNNAEMIELREGDPSRPNRYLIGVGSAGQPEDGAAGRYAVYDGAAGNVWLLQSGK